MNASASQNLSQAWFGTASFKSKSTFFLSKPVNFESVCYEFSNNGMTGWRIDVKEAAIVLPRLSKPCTLSVRCSPQRITGRWLRQRLSAVSRYTLLSGYSHLYTLDRGLSLSWRTQHHHWTFTSFANLSFFPPIIKLRHLHQLHLNPLQKQNQLLQILIWYTSQQFC